MSAIKEELHKTISKLNDDEAESLLNFLQKMFKYHQQKAIYDIDEEQLSEKEIKEIEKAKDGMAQGEFIDLEAFKKDMGI